MNTQIFTERIKADDIVCELFEVGGFDVTGVDSAASVHSKTCQHIIFAQALQGHYEITCGDGRQAVLTPGEAFLTGSNVPLRITHCGDPEDGFRMRARWLHLRCLVYGGIDVATLLDLPLRVSCEECAPFGSIIDELRGGHPESGSANPLLFSMRWQEQAFRALRFLCELAPLRSDAHLILRDKDRFGNVLRCMRENLAGGLTVADLSENACLSVPRFHAWFKHLAGRSPMEYFKQMRLAEACRLLVRNDLAIKEVAERTGFCNEFHLSRDFRRAFGKPPGQWRRDQVNSFAQELKYDP
jgi:AraC-like DNA-binding protein